MHPLHRRWWFVRYLLDNPDVYLVRGRWVRVPKRHGSPPHNPRSSRD